MAIRDVRRGWTTLLLLGALVAGLVLGSLVVQAKAANIERQERARLRGTWVGARGTVLRVDRRGLLLDGKPEPFRIRRRGQLELRDHGPAPYRLRRGRSPWGQRVRVLDILLPGRGRRALVRVRLGAVQRLRGRFCRRDGEVGCLRFDGRGGWRERREIAADVWGYVTRREVASSGLYRVRGRDVWVWEPVRSARPRRGRLVRRGGRVVAIAFGGARYFRR